MMINKMKDFTVTPNQSNLNFKYAWLTLIICALVILAVGEFTNIDLMIEDYYYDPILKTFPWKDAWFANDLMHNYLKKMIKVCGLILYVVLIINLIRPLRFLSAWIRYRLWFVAVSSLLIPFIVGTLKRITDFNCPWDIDRYNGTFPFIKLLDHIPDVITMSSGNCFPAGHATTGLWLASLCIFWLPNKPRQALGVFILGLLFGLVLGWVQQMRGAHFLFHTLWSMWLASLIILIMLECAKICAKKSLSFNNYYYKF